jgi:hypothetical protein
MMLQDVIDNLNNIMSGKQEFLDILMNHVNIESSVVEVLKMNIGELRRIREDLIEVQKSQQTA